MSDNTDESLEDFDERVAGNGFRVISPPEWKPVPPPGPELRALLDDMKRRQRGTHGRPEEADDTPDAA